MAGRRITAKWRRAMGNIRKMRSISQLEDRIDALTLEIQMLKSTLPNFEEQEYFAPNTVDLNTIRHDLHTFTFTSLDLNSSSVVIPSMFTEPVFDPTPPIATATKNELRIVAEPSDKENYFATAGKKGFQVMPNRTSTPFGTLTLKKRANALNVANV